MKWLFKVDIKKRQVTITFFLLFFLSTVFTLVSSAISHLKEEKISFAEKIFCLQNSMFLNHSKKMAYNLHKLSDGLWLWNSLGLNGMELQGKICLIKYSLYYGQDIQRIWLKRNKYRIRIFFQTAPQNQKSWPKLLKNLFLTKYLHKGSKLYLTWNSSK